MTPVHRLLVMCVLVTLPVAGGLVATAQASGSSPRVAASSSPPSCAASSKNTDCVHAPTTDVSVQPAPTLSTTYNAKHRIRVIHLKNATFAPPYTPCPNNASVPLQDIPCSFLGLSVAARLYMPDGSPAQNVGGEQPYISGTDCERYLCKDVTFDMPSEYYGPGTLIVNYGIGNLLNSNQPPPGKAGLSSSYEDTFRIPADPVAHTVHLTKPRTVFAGKIQAKRFELAGKGGIPRHGVAGIIVRVASPGYGELVGGDDDGFGNSGITEVAKGTSIKVLMQQPAKITITTLGYYTAKAGLSGDLEHLILGGARPVHVTRRISLTHKTVPTDATAAILEVTSPHGASTFGGVKIAKSGDTQTVLATLHHGAVLLTNTSRGTKISIEGYFEPLHGYDEGQPLNPVLSPSGL